VALCTIDNNAEMFQCTNKECRITRVRFAVHHGYTALPMNEHRLLINLYTYYVTSH